MKIPSMLLLLTSLLLYLHLGEGQNTSGTEEWRKLICHKSNNAQGGLLEIKMDKCDITTIGAEGTCSYTLITDKVLKSVCSVLYNDYTCLISPKFTGSACCYVDGVKKSCLPKITPTPTSTPSSTKFPVTSARVSVGTIPTPSSEAEHMGNGSNHVIDILVGTIIPVIVAAVVVVIIVLVCVKHNRSTRRKTQWCQRKHNNSDNNPDGGEANGVVDDSDDNERDSVVNKARNGKAKGGDKPNKPQKNPQLLSRDGPKATISNRFKQNGRAVEMRRRPLQNVQETEIEEDSEWLSTRTAIHGLGTDWTSQSVMQHFIDNYEPPTFNSISGPSCNTQEDMSFPSDQASDDGNTFYVPMPLKSSSLVRKLNNKDLVTAHMSHLECKDDTQEKSSMSSVVQGHMQSLDHDDQQKKQNISSVVARKRLSCFKSDDQTRRIVSRKSPLKKHKFPPVLFGAVLVVIIGILAVVIIGILALATRVPHGNSYMYPSTDLHPYLAYKYRWLDRGTPWIRALADRLTYPQMFDLHNLGPAAYYGIFLIPLTTLIYLYNQYQHMPTGPTLNHWTSLTLLKTLGGHSLLIDSCDVTSSPYLYISNLVLITV